MRSVPGGRLMNRVSRRPPGRMVPTTRAVGKDAAHARSSVEAGIGEKFADHERPGLFGAKLLGPRGDRTQYACTGDNSNPH